MLSLVSLGAAHATVTDINWNFGRPLTTYDIAVDLCRALGRDVPWITRPQPKKEQKRRGTGTPSCQDSSLHGHTQALGLSLKLAPAHCSEMS